MAETWRFAADSKYRYFTALGNASALATAESVDGPSLVGADDYDDITDIPAERLRVRLAQVLFLVSIVIAIDDLPSALREIPAVLRHSRRPLALFSLRESRSRVPRLQFRRRSVPANRHPRVSSNTEKPEHLDIVSRHRLVGDSWPYTPVEAGFDPCVARDILADAEATCGSVTGVHSRLYHTYTTFEGRYLLGGTLESVLIIATVNPRS